MAIDCVFVKYTGPERSFNQFVPDLGLAYLSAALKQAGYSARLFNLDLPGNSPAALLNYLDQHRPPVLAIKLIRTGGIPALLELAAEARRVSPTTLIIGGGPHAKACQETLFNFTGAFDALLTGESDRAIVQAVEVAHGRRELAAVENVLFMDSNGSPVKGTASVIADLDELPQPDWSLFDLERYLPIFLVAARKGCPFACAFCNYNFIDSRETVETHLNDRGGVRVVRSLPDRKRSLPSLRREVTHNIQQYGARLFALADSMPAPELVSDLCDWLIEANLTTRWTSFGRIKSMDHIFHKMARAGWVSLWFGIESGNEEILGRMNKFYSARQIKETIAAARQAGLQSTGGFIVGFPGETEETLAETLTLIRALPLNSLVFTPFVLAPGALVAELPEQYGIRPYEGWLKRYAYLPNGRLLHETPYFEIDGLDNVSHYHRFKPRIDAAYQTFSTRQLVDDSDYAALVASILEDVSMEEVLKSDRLLAAEDLKGWHSFLGKIWRAATR